LPRAGCLAGAFFVIRAQYATADSRALQLLQHPAPMLYLARAEDARERRRNQLHAFGAIDPGAVTLETENATTVPRTMCGTGHLHPPTQDRKGV
jgi:hypothetical protein